MTAATVLLLALSVGTALLWRAKRRTGEARAQQSMAFQLSFGAIGQITQSLEDGSDGLPPAPGSKAEQASFIAVAYYDRIAKMLAEDEVMQEVVAKALRGAGHGRTARGKPRGLEDYREAVRVYERIAARSPGWIWLRTGLIETLQEYADGQSALGDTRGAEASTRRALEVAEGLVGDKQAGLPCFRKGLVGPFSDLAWGLVDRPTVGAGDMALAFRLARQAAEWEPAQPAPWRALGLAYYRAGDFPAAAAALEKSMGLSDGGDAHDWLWLAAVRQRQGDAQQARGWYDRAVSRMGQGEPGAQGARLRRARAEAAQVLGLPTKPEPPPALPPGATASRS
jgi:tetratricopeptide (TPR) repeat protein